MTTPTTSFLTLPTELRVIIYEFVLGGSDPFEILYHLVQLDSGTFKTDYSHDACSVDSSHGSSPRASCHCDACTRDRALTVLSLVQTSDQIRNEVLPRRLLRQTRLFVETQSYHKGWKAAVVQDSNETPTFFVIPGHLTPHQLLSGKKRSCFLWPKNMPAWKEDMLMQVFNSVSCSVSYNHYFMVNITFTISINGEISVDVRLVPHPHWKDGLTTYPNEYVELQEKNDTAIAKLQARIERRVSAFPKINRELIKDVVDILRDIGWHFYSRDKEIPGPHGTFDTMWHISVPSTTLRKERWSREAGTNGVQKLGHVALQYARSALWGG